MVDTHVLMHPKTSQVWKLQNVLRTGRAEALEHLPDIPQVKGVVRLPRLRKQYFPGGVIQSDRSCHHVTDRLSHRDLETGQEMAQHGLKDRSYSTISQLRIGQHIEVAGHPGSDEVTASARRPHSSHEDDVLDVDVLLVLGEDVPGLVIEVLPQKLDGGLRPVDLFLGHVKVVHEDHALLALGGTHTA